MKLNQLITVILFTAFTSAVFAQENIDAIVKKYEAKKITDIEKYITANPEAEDLDAGYFFLANAHGSLGQHEQALTALDARYAMQEKGEKAPVQMIVQEIIAPYMRSTEELGDKSRALKLVEQMRTDFKDHSKSAQLNQMFDQIEQTLNRPKPPKVGETMQLSFTATDGTEVNLEEMKGKVVLVDFWATWCPPCVKEMPHVVAAYKKHKDSGFDVIGISLDQDKAKMEAFMSENEMPWVQYFDGAGWGNKLAGKMGISGIPATFLIGKDGTIVDSNLRGDALDSAIVKALAAE